ncbi:hypothetical protein K443DRAFT_7712 [Laccaria amethystina LaAM-08-1]|uniref:Uncharacterized protein n=1 Tax=Laccaria amethystina LaAM-08-1 TaxID=1095629 RepID=A0A0C9XFF2_9AGAR|nr:hypothetical protein K443DRAFT_7712 [Laccaria amethystina LaAM-08-1]
MHNGFPQPPQPSPAKTATLSPSKVSHRNQTMNAKSRLSSIDNDNTTQTTMTPPPMDGNRTQRQ